MTNDEIRIHESMTNGRITNVCRTVILRYPEGSGCAVGKVARFFGVPQNDISGHSSFDHSSLIRHSDFVIRHLSFVVLFIVSCFAAISRADPGITYEPTDGPGKGKTLVFLTGDEEYRSEEGLPMLAKILSQRHGFKCTVLFSMNPDGTINPDVKNNEPGIEALDHADGIVMLLRFRAWPDDTMKHFVNAVQRGVPIVALRTSTHAFQYPANSTATYKSWGDKAADSFGKKILGEEWVSHWAPNGRGATRGVIEPAAKDNPLLNGVTDIFAVTGVYETHPNPDSTILVRGQVLKGMKPTDAPDDYLKTRTSDKQQQGVNDPMMPVAWTRINKNANGSENKVLCTTMGAATDLQSEDLRRLLVNGVYWGAGLPIPAKADVTYVDDFKPIPYGARAYRKWITPADHALGKVLPAGQK